MHGTRLFTESLWKSYMHFYVEIWIVCIRCLALYYICKVICLSQSFFATLSAKVMLEEIKMLFRHNYLGRYDFACTRVFASRLDKTLEWFIYTDHSEGLKLLHHTRATCIHYLRSHAYILTSIYTFASNWNT